MAGFMIGPLPVFRYGRIAIMILIAYLLYKNKFFLYYKDFFKSNIFTIPILLVLISMLISSVLSYDLKASLFFLGSTIFESLILTVIIFSVFKTDDDIILLINTLCLTAITLCILALYEQSSGENIFRYFGVFSTEYSGLLEHSVRLGKIRVAGPFDISIAFGAYLAIMLSLSLYKYRNNIIKFGIIIFLFFLAIDSTGSRSPMIGAIVILFGFFIFNDKKNFAVLLFAAIPVLFIYSDVIIATFIKINPFLSTDEMLNSSSNERIIQFNYYLPFIKENILFGNGIIPIPAMMRGDPLYGGEGNYVRTLDNFYLLYSWNYGLVGLGTWIFMMIATFIKPISIFGKQILKEKLLITLILGVVAFCIENFVVALFTYHFVYWIILGIIARICANKLEEYKKNQSNK